MFTLVLVVTGTAALAALDRTAYASWSERITSALLILAAIVMVRRNLRDGQYRPVGKSI